MSRRGTHPAEFVQDELKARGWTTHDLAVYGGEADVFLAELAWDFYLLADPHIRMGELGAVQLSKAFGTSVDLWRNLEANYVASLSEG